MGTVLQGFPGGAGGKEPALRDEGRALGQEDPLEEGKATDSSILAWIVPWTEEPGGLHSPRGLKESDTAEET